MSTPTTEKHPPTPEPPSPNPSFDETWSAWFEAHPEVLASWRHQNGYLPMGAGDDGV